MSPQSGTSPMSKHFGHFRQSNPPEDAWFSDALDINDRITRINARQSEIFVADESSRKRFWAKHSTFFASFDCMDGRISFPTVTKTPIGIVKSFRALGGKFEAFWPGLRNHVRDLVNSAMRKGTRNLSFVTYHYSSSHPKLGCKGWNNDTEASKMHAHRFAADLADVYQGQMYVVVTGVDTDTDTMTLHGPSGDVCGARLIDMLDEDIRVAVRSAFPKMDSQTQEDLIPFLSGNAQRIAELRESPRTHEELGHGERIVGVGNEFSWLVRPNYSLVFNDFDPNLDHAIVTSAKIVEENIRDAKPGDDATLFVCMPYSDPGIDERDARASVMGLLRFAQGHIRELNSQLWSSGRFHHLAGIVHRKSLELEVIEDSLANTR